MRSIPELNALIVPTSVLYLYGILSDANEKIAEPLSDAAKPKMK
jgi:hypothetical protein